jgi:hypothetical protein
MIAARARLSLALVVSILVSASGCVRPKPENQVMRLGDDVLASGSAPFLNDSIAGDAILAGGDIVFRGRTGGDYVAAGGKQDIRGRVHGSMRAAGGEVVVNASVDRNATIGGGRILVDSSAVIGRNAYLIGGDIKVRGTVTGGLLATGGAVDLDGTIGQDVEVSSGSLRLGPNARIAGNLSYRVSKEGVHIDPAARVTGKVTALPVIKSRGLFGMLWRAGGLLAGVVIVLLIPRFVTDATETLKHRPIRAVIVSIVGTILGLIAMIIAAITVIGIPLALVGAAFLIFLGAMSEIPVAVWIGEKILHGRTLLGRQRPLVNFFIGGLVLIIVGIIPVIGGVVRLISSCIGFGAILLAAWSVHQRQVA